MANSWRSSSIRNILGSSAASSTLSSSPGPRERIRCSRVSLRRPFAPSGSVARRLRRSRRLATDVRIFQDDALFVIAGPCVLEDDALNLRVAEKLAKLAEKVPGGIVYKASFDKANRSNADAARGPGIDDGLRALERVKKASGLRVLTDVHLPDQCAFVAEVADVLQIPAFLCRQTDLLEAAGATGRAVNIKKGQWMHPEGMRGAVEKVRGATSEKRLAKGDRRVSLPATRLSDIAVTERGTFFGYGDLVVDMRDFARM